MIAPLPLVVAIVDGVTGAVLASNDVVGDQLTLWVATRLSETVAEPGEVCGTATPVWTSL